ncbi:hypothetical protein J3E72DRAFT_46626 [Bipolaris maydis]|uniref:uncharacterized protein n=1 Tax=Cochliobolus heterostrophus TaxID=5016 RepID=UPI0024D7CE0D|nr:hypothetical protein J3E73DRAFT_50020 [Bipolaris maydis]KAJ5064129.1 hypothetical protein J3E74DRAFT_24352 [Bipolaris maydis]KAJ6196725.1 hypothetical protein J3E72DRAFT_46626 [Bipolaris maydis]KAJ6207612.1 hypothetical protein PSV09DRAFT_2046734 [Bipolaris maydis]KAJ6269739.1 hypothetical protein PSV08DRAFT_48076 [Bipolaris maydis]
MLLAPAWFLICVFLGLLVFMEHGYRIRQGLAWTVGRRFPHIFTPMEVGITRVFFFSFTSALVTLRQTNEALNTSMLPSCSTDVSSL